MSRSSFNDKTFTVDKKILTKWILVTDSCKATIGEINGAAIHQVGGDYCADDVIVQGDLEESRSGFRKKASVPGHFYDPTTEQKDLERQKFMAHLANELNSANSHSKFDRLTLIAEPKSLGDLRKLLDQSVIEKVDKEIAKDLTNLSLDEVVEYL